MDCEIEIRCLFVAAGHQFVGRHGKEPLTYVMEARETIECVAGKGIMGDRFFDYKPNYKGQLTFFSEEVYLKLKRQLSVEMKSSAVFRRNVLVSGIDLNPLIGKRFGLGEVEFEGVEEASPCYWMDRAFGEGAAAALRGQGGLRVRILSDGKLSRGVQRLCVFDV
ncbi:MAG: hypothetical protein M2R45_03842 [Verrucomicrobia subdivision 3 bacterium]|nr:hypothetical protein [Limisphaerales bacterium]MCS1415798.1 hypothetical protein [Limisphaerales bacterium]